MNRLRDSILIGVFVTLALATLHALAAGGPGVSGPMHNVGSTVITGGTSNRLLRNNAGVLANSLLSDNGTDVTLTSGQLLVPDATAAAPAIRSSTVNTGINFNGSTSIDFTRNGNAAWAMTALNFQIISTGGIGWSPTATATATPDILLSRAAANRLALATGDSLEAESYRDITLNAVCATPPADHVNYCTHDGSNFTGTATNDCARVAVLDDGTEVLIQILRTDVAC